MRCLECDAEAAEQAQVCARCGAPVANKQPAANTPVGGSSSLPHKLIAQQPGPGSRRNALVLAGLGLVVLVAVIILVVSVATIITRLNSSTSSKSSRSSASSARTPSPSASSAPTSASSASSSRQVDSDQLQPGECLTGSDLGLGNANPLPDYVTVVPCTQLHLAEVFFSGNAWPQSLAYPGDTVLDHQALTRCLTAFKAYDGADNSASAYDFDYYYPGPGADWASGDRQLVCIAYDDSQDPGGAPMFGSIKGTGQ
jgi:hypothetical protein